MKKRILCFGDSNTWGYIAGKGTRFSEEKRYTGIIARELGEDYVVIEEGLNGRTTAFSDRIEPQRCALEHIMPILLSQLPLDYMVIMLGTNDTKTHFHVNAVEIGYGMEELLANVFYILKRWNSSAKVLLVAPTPIQPVDDPMFNQASEIKSRQLGTIYKGLANEYGCLYLDAGNLNMNLSVDGIHLNKESHKILGNEIARMIKIEENGGI